MTTINVLTNTTFPCSRAFNRPLSVSKKILKGKKLSIKFCLNLNQKILESDILFINSNVFRTYWTDKKEDIFSFLEKARSAGQKIIWFDTTDSTWSTQFEILPYVDQYLKNQIFKDKKQYLIKYRTGRIFTDFFEKIYKVGETEYEYLIPEENQLDKIDIGWSSCFENYNESRFSIPTKLSNKLDPLICNISTGSFKINFTDPNSKRNNDITSRFGLSHSRKSVVAHRKAIKELVEKNNVDCGSIPFREYFKELRNSRISISPFGVGEFCYRDYESIVCGAVLVKPDMSHLRTWPDLYQNNITYIPHKWDLSDFEKVIDDLINNPEKCCRIAKNAQAIYRKAVSENGMEIFAERITDICNSV